MVPLYKVTFHPLARGIAIFLEKWEVGKIDQTVATWKLQLSVNCLETMMRLIEASSV